LLLPQNLHLSFIQHHSAVQQRRRLDFQQGLIINDIEVVEFDGADIA
jgi:hypothetical protein